MKRRNFIKTAGLAGIPILLDRLPVRALNPESLWSAMASAATNTDHVLVIVQLVGGNDGLNTIVPLDKYSVLNAARGNVLIPESKLLKATGHDTIGFHPAFSGMKNLFAEGKMQIIQNVGYPQQNYSHFRSTDIWMSASDADKTVPSGWTGRYLNYEYSNYPVGYPNTDMPDPLGIQIGGFLSLNLMGPSASMGMAISNPNDVFTKTTGIPDAAPATNAGIQLEYVRQVAQQTGKYTTVVNAAANKVSTQQSYPANNDLAAQLKVVAKLIAGGLKTRVYIVSIGGFDTHSVQTDKTNKETGVHAELLKKTSEAISSFVADCEYLGIADRVLGMTMSEFGRRIKSNDSQGTDHGSAAPVFMFGKPVKGNTILGSNPVIPTQVGVEDNLAMEYDFRSIYSTVLQDWFCLSENTAEQILMKPFSKLDILKNPCSTASIREKNQMAGKAVLQCYPSPFTSSTTVSYYTNGEYLQVELFDYHGHKLLTIADQVVPKGQYEQYLNLEHLAAGNYYVRLINGQNSQVKFIQKVR